MYNGGGGGDGGSRPPTAQMPEMRYANSASPRPPTGAAARPYTAGSYQEQPAQGPSPYYRPPTQGSQVIPPPTSHSNVAFDLQDNGRRPSMPTPVYDRPSYSRANSPAPYAGYNESHEDFHGHNYGNEETYPLTAYPSHPMTPGTPYDGFEGDTGNAQYDTYFII
jgi:hypothetical protein